MEKSKYMTVTDPQSLDPFERWQLEKYGNVLGTAATTPDGDLLDSGLEELDRLAEWTAAQNERQMYEFEQYGNR